MQNESQQEQQLETVDQNKSYASPIQKDALKISPVEKIVPNPGVLNENEEYAISPSAEPNIGENSKISSNDNNNNNINQNIGPNSIPPIPGRSSSPTPSYAHSRASYHSMFSNNSGRVHGLPYPQSRNGQYSSLNSARLLSSSQTIASLAYSAIADDSDFFPGAIFEYFKGSFSAFPDFNSLTPTSCGIIDNISIGDTYGELPFIRAANLHNSDDSMSSLGDFAIRFTFCINIPVAGIWTFNLGSNDGSMLYISGKQVIANDGVHYVVEKEGKVKFSQPGMYPARLLFFHKNGKVMEGIRRGTFLELSYSFKGTGWMPFPPDRIVRQPIPIDSIFHSRDCEEYRTFSQFVNETMLSPEEEMLQDNSRDNIEIMQLEMRQMADKIILLEKLLDSERKHSESMISLLKTSLNFSNKVSSEIESNEDVKSDDSTEQHQNNVIFGVAHDSLHTMAKHKEEEEIVHEYLSNIDLLKVGYFFSLGTQLKMRGALSSNIKIQDLYEHLNKSPIDQWSSKMCQVTEDDLKRDNNEEVD